LLLFCGIKDSLVALHQGTPGQMTWLEDPPPWLLPCLALPIVNRK